MDPSSLFLPLLLVLVVGLLFVSSRNNKKRQAAAQQMQESLQAGTRVQLTSGLNGTIVSASDGPNIDIEIAPGVVTSWNKLAVREVIAADDADATNAAGAAVAGPDAGVSADDIESAKPVQPSDDSDATLSLEKAADDTDDKNEK